MRSSLPVVLASASPRRQQILRELIPSFTVAVADLDEDALTLDDPWLTAETLGLAKARFVSAIHPNAIVIAADTVVALPADDGYVQLTKPRSASDATQILRRLSGKRHAVITGVAIVQGEIERVRSDTAWVTFRDLSDAEICEYVATGEPMDKAGAYGIQGGAAQFVRELEGDLLTVVGLPIEVVRQLMKELSGVHEEESPGQK